MIDAMNNLAQVSRWLLLITVPLALVSGYKLLVIDRRDRLQRSRLEAFRGAVRVAPHAVQQESVIDQIGAFFASILGIVEQQRLLKLLTAAGVKGRISLTQFLAAKSVLAAMPGSAVWLSQVFANVMLGRFAVVGVALAIGWRLPDFVLNRLVSRRRLRLEKGMPDALDLLVICAEAGLSLNQAIEEISRQLRRSNKDIADEFSLTSAEMQVLPDFSKALDNLVERTGLTNLQSLIATLKQSLKFGTPLAESLRMIAAEMRAERQAKMEERAARLPVILAVPMMLFILPCLFMIIGTPVVLRLMDTFKNLSFGGGTP